MTTRPCSAAAAAWDVTPLRATPLKCNRELAAQIRKLGTAASHSSGRFYSASWSLFGFGRAILELDTRYSTNYVEKLRAEGEGSLDYFSGLENGEERVRQVRLEDLRIGGLYKGKVSVVESYGVFVDIGTHVDGFVHISRLGRSSMRKEEDVMQVGKDVTVQIVDLDPRADSLSLLMAPDGCFTEILKLQPLTLSEQEILNRAATRRANKIARCAETPSVRRVMSLETRQRLKAHRRAVLAERQAIQLHQSRLNTSLYMPARDDPG